MVHPNGRNPKDFRVRTLAEQNWGCDAIGCHQRHPGRLSLDFPDNHLPFVQGHNATAWAGELGPVIKH
jgi:hypothetical protein